MIKQSGILHTGKRLILVLFLMVSVSYGKGLVDAVALIVNDKPITLYDIEKRKYQTKSTKEEAVNQLIDEVLYDDLIKKYSITADILEIDNYVEKIAASNGMDLYTFKSILKQKYKNYDRYEQEVRNTIIKQKLTAKLVRGNVEIASNEDLKIFYDNNQSMFQSSTNVKVVQYVSPDKNQLLEFMKNPVANVESISNTPLNLEQAKLNPQLRYIINETKINQFTPIFTANKQFVTLFITKKEGEQNIPYEQVKDKIFNIVMQDREQKFLKDYFEKQRLSANIKIVR